MNWEAILIQWLVTPGNNSKYRCKNILGKREIQYSSDEIARKINDAGIMTWRRCDRVFFQRSCTLRVENTVC
jgi:hypothetical protein